MEFLADGVQAISLDFSIAFAARRRQELLEAVLAVQVSLLFNEADVDEFTLAAGVDAQEVSWAPGFAQSGDEWTSDLASTSTANWDTSGRRLGEHTLAAVGAGGGEGASVLRHCTGLTYRTFWYGSWRVAWLGG